MRKRKYVLMLLQGMFRLAIKIIKFFIRCCCTIWIANLYNRCLTKHQNSKRIRDLLVVSKVGISILMFWNIDMGNPLKTRYAVNIEMQFYDVKHHEKRGEKNTHRFLVSNTRKEYSDLGNMLASVNDKIDSSFARFDRAHQ